MIAYQLLCGRLPDDPETFWEQYAALESATVTFQPKKLWDKISKEGKDFIEKCLHKEPSERPTAAELARHPWLQMPDKDGGIDLSEVKEKLTNFINSPRIRRKDN